MTDSPEDTRARLAEALPAAALRELAERYLSEPRNHFHGQAVALVAPANVDEAARVVRVAGATGTPIVPYGGGTGTVGGQVSPEGNPPIVVSMERMAAIRDVWPREGVLVAEAGAILADIQAEAARHDLLFPLSLAAEGSCRIGGNLATNAGGLNVLRYGTTRDLCLGLEAVLPDGSIWHGLKRLRKDNTGYALKDLLIGSEGTLGLITAASLRLAPRPARSATAIFAIRDPDAALELLAIARREAGETVSAFELIGGQSFVFLAEAMPHVRQPFDAAPDWAVLIELGMDANRDPQSVLMAIFEAGMAAGLADDGVVSQSETQRKAFWAVRENIPEANRLIGAVASHDISLPLGALPDFIARGAEAVAAVGDLRINVFGHVGDGNLHYNVFPPAGGSKADFIHLREAATRAVHDLVAEMDGAFSAEHGVGRLKVGELERYGDPVRLAAMRAIKRALDPQGIMNPGAVLRA